MTTEQHGLSIRETVVTVKGRHYKRFIVDLGTVDGKRTRRSFKTQSEAEAAILQQQLLARRIGMESHRLKTDNLLDATRALRVLKPFGIGLAEAADFYAKYHSPTGTTLTIKELVDLFLDAKKAKGLRPRSMDHLRNSLKPFCADLGNKQIVGIQTPRLAAFLGKRGWHPITQGNVRRVLTNLFGFAVKSKYLKLNPATDLDTPLFDKTVPGILTPDEAQKIMATAVEKTPQLVPYFALCLFAGIRPQEAQLLDWSNINLTASRITVPPEVDKCRQGRYVNVQPNLAAWLLPYKQDAGQIFYSRRLFEQVQRKAVAKWSKDCMRHSFASYHLAMFEDAGKTAMQLGHYSNVRTLFEHYRAMATKETAEQYFAIEPKTKIHQWPVAKEA